MSVSHISFDVFYSVLVFVLCLSCCSMNVVIRVGYVVNTNIVKTSRATLANVTVKNSKNLSSMIPKSSVLGFFPKRQFRTTSSETPIFIVLSGSPKRCKSQFQKVLSWPCKSLLSCPSFGSKKDPKIGHQSNSRLVMRFTFQISSVFEKSYSLVERRIFLKNKHERDANIGQQSNFLKGQNWTPE